MINPSYKKILVIGSGPIIIGQAAEFDYAGTQACKSLREEGIETILINSNPATIMTDADIADKVYIEPLTIPIIEKIIEKETPDALLPTLGGQTGLNLAIELYELGILEKHNVKLLGSNVTTIKNAEDRHLFREMLSTIGEPVPPSIVANNQKEAYAAKNQIGLPLVIRPAYTLGGTGGGIANSEEEFEEIVTSGLSASPIHQILIEKSIVGWKELEYEVMRDSANNCITICNMENIDPMGVHTGDSIVVAPSQTLTDNDHQMLRSASLKIIRELGIEGGCNVQFALAPNDIIGKTLPDYGEDQEKYYVIEVNPRVSRSSALASKATGYPIARVAAKIAIGKTLDEISNSVTHETLAAFEPSLDYCVVKIPRWPFDKFSSGDRTLGTQMKATGEVMSIDRTFESAFQKAIRSLEIDNHSILWENPKWVSSEDPEAIDKAASIPNDERIWAVMAILRKGISAKKISEMTGIDPWFISAFQNLIKMEKKLTQNEMDFDLMRAAKRLGFSDPDIAMLTNTSSEKIRQLRKEYGLCPVYKMVDTCAGEFEAITPYFYSTYEDENEATPLDGPKSIVIGSGPIRIGQGIEFDYCSVHAAWALQEEGVKSIMINSNPETVSTDFDTSDRLYFEPLDEESIRDIIENETPPNSDDSFTPSIVQFGGQTAINLSQILDKCSLPILGSSAKSIDTASDRHLFEEFLEKTGIPNPPGSAVFNLEEALNVAQEVGYPVLVRPSYVLGGRAMEIVHNATELARYMNTAFEAGGRRRVLIDKYFEGREVEVDAICDGDNVLIPGIIEHVERAGVHSGDSMAIYPALTLSKKEVDTIVDYTIRIGKSLKIKGLMNIQYVVVGGSTYRNPQESRNQDEKTEIYVIEVNPRSSRTIPFISKITGVPMVNLAVKAMLGRKITDFGYKQGLWKKQNLIGVKAPVFSMSKLSGVDTFLGPEMKSTGEVMGIDKDFESAAAKALIASNLMLPEKGSILLSVSDDDKADSIQLIHELHKIGYSFFATEGTASVINGLGLPVVMVPKILDREGPNVVDIISNGTVNAVINTVTGHRDVLQDGFHIRRAAVDKKIPCFTSIDTARTAVSRISKKGTSFNVTSIQEHLEIK